MPGAGLSDGCNGKALSDMPAFQPYWGKPAVRNDRGDGGNVGIIRSPLRATVPPDCGGRSANDRPYLDIESLSSILEMMGDRCPKLGRGFPQAVGADYVGSAGTSQFTWDKRFKSDRQRKLECYLLLLEASAKWLRLQREF